MKKETEDKIVIRRFKDRSSHFWINNHHYFLDENNEIEYACGGIDRKEYREALKNFIKRNKVTFIPREKSIFEQEEREYSKIGFGKYSQTTTIELVATDKRYASWLYKNCSDSKIKEELKELLKINKYDTRRILQLKYWKCDLQY